MFQRQGVKKRILNPKNPWAWVAFWIIVLIAIIRLIIEAGKFLIDK